LPIFYQDLDKNLRATSAQKGVSASLKDGLRYVDHFINRCVNHETH